MSVTSPQPGVLQISRFGPFSCLLVTDDDGLTLIDTNFAGSGKAILDAIASVGKPLRRILVTHAHADHVGSLDAIVAAVPGVEVVTSARTARLLAGDRSLDLDESGLSLKGGYAAVKSVPTVLLDDGESYAGYRAVFTPGHAVGHVSYLQLSTGALFCGDALISAGGGLHVSGVFKLGFPFPYFATASRSLALDSARKLAQLAPTAIYPIHGPAVLDAAPALANAINEAERVFIR